MKLLPPILACAGGIFVSVALTGETLTARIDGFADPGTFSITEGDKLDLRVGELIPGPASNSSTHILIEGLSPLEDGTPVYASTYSGIDATDNSIRDLGVLYLNLPTGGLPAESSVVSPIVGIVPRTGGWNSYSPAIPDNTLNGATGAGDYSPSSIEMNLQNGAGTFTGSVLYSVVDQDTLNLDPFVLTLDGVTSYSMAGCTLSRDGDRFYGVLTNLSEGAAYDSLLFKVELTNIPDADGDNVPDISDEVVAEILIPGVWQQSVLGLVYGFSDNWAYSKSMGFVYLAMPYIFQMNHGWCCLGYSELPDFPAGGMYLYDFDAGWIYSEPGYGSTIWLVGSDPAVFWDFLLP